MIRDNRRFSSYPMKGGLDLESTPQEIPAGAMILAHNYHVKAGGGYTRIGGYERFDGQPSPSSSADKDAARALIQAVPGSGPVRGTVWFQGSLYAFRDTADGLAAKMHKSTGTGWEEVVTPVLGPGGKHEFITHNFYGASTMKRVYGVDGTNKPFMYDGTTYTELNPPGTMSEPKHIAEHANHLFLSYEDGQYLHSGIGEPTAWDAATEGAGSGGTGDDIVGMRATIGGALCFFMRNKINLLYGKSKADWQANDLRKQQEQAGAIEWTVQDLGDLVYLDDRGLTSLQQTQAFGNFESGTLDKQVKRLIQSAKSKVLCSAVSRTRNQYILCLDHTEGTEVITLTFSGHNLDGYGRSLYPFKASCITSQEDGTGKERIFVGTDSGFTYELEKGTSFDGAEIESYFKLAFGHLGTPNQNKKYNYLTLGLEASSELSLRVKPEFDYGSAERGGHRVVDADIVGSGGEWDNSDWSEFTWSSQIVSEAKVDITGTGGNMALLVYHKGADTAPFTIYDATIHYSMRGLRR